MGGGVPGFKIKKLFPQVRGLNVVIFISAGQRLSVHQWLDQYNRYNHIHCHTRPRGDEDEWR
jgi:hypothetical protein